MILGSACNYSGNFAEVTGTGTPEYDSSSEDKRLVAYDSARQDAWTQLYDIVRSEPAGSNVLVGDLLVVDERLRSIVLNTIWNAEVTEQKYDPDDEVASISIRYDLDQIPKLLNSVK